MEPQILVQKLQGFISLILYFSYPLFQVGILIPGLGQDDFDFLVFDNQALNSSLLLRYLAGAAELGVF